MKTAYIAAADRYATVEELPSGRGVADVVYLPRGGDPSPSPFSSLGKESL